MTSPSSLPPVHVHSDRQHIESLLAHELSQDLRAGVSAGRPLTLGLATGSSMVGLYECIVQLHREGRISFDGVRTFNLDEYLGLGQGHPQSFHTFMAEHLFTPVGLTPDCAFVPDADLAASEPEAYSAVWEAAIQAAGGLDVQFLGIGANGHIAFNEPGSEASSSSRVVDLCDNTRERAARYFGGIASVPLQAFTAGLATISSARSLRLMAFGEDKAQALRAMLHGPVGTDSPASLIRSHPELEIWADDAAASLLDLANLGESIADAPPLG